MKYINAIKSLPHRKNRCTTRNARFASIIQDYLTHSPRIDFSFLVFTSICGCKPFSTFSYWYKVDFCAGQILVRFSDFLIWRDNTVSVITINYYQCAKDWLVYYWGGYRSYESGFDPWVVGVGWIHFKRKWKREATTSITFERNKFEQLHSIHPNHYLVLLIIMMYFR